MTSSPRQDRPDPALTPPSWLPAAFSRAAAGAGATAGARDLERGPRASSGGGMEPARRYHNVRHLVDLLQHVDELQQETHNPHTIRLAAWYHGAVFDAEAPAAYARRGGEDEVASAAYARTHLAAIGVPEKAIDEVVEMVEALERHAPTDCDSDCAVLCDADLAILAADPQRYRAYTDDIRAEYEHIPARDYLHSRSAILAKLPGPGQAVRQPARRAVGGEGSPEHCGGDPAHRLRARAARRPGVMSPRGRSPRILPRAARARRGPRVPS